MANYMKYKRFLSAFTVPELLISMLVSAVLVAALVPVVGVKKIKYPIVRYNHGIAECYYSGNTLMYYYESNGKNKSMNTATAVGGNHCTFTVPNVQYLQMYVIGAGGNSGGNQIAGVSSIGNTAITGYVNAGGTFQDDIAKADLKYEGLSSKVKGAFNDWAKTMANGIPVQYTVKSPIGIGGKGMCRSARINSSSACNTACAGGLTTASCYGPFKNSSDGEGRWYSIGSASARAVGTEYCWTFVHGQGQASGVGKSKTFTGYINGNTEIDVDETYERAGIAISNASGVQTLYLTKSGDGHDAVATSDGYTYNSSVPSSPSCTSNISGGCSNLTSTTSTPGSKGGFEKPLGSTCESYYTAGSNVAKKGAVSFTPNTFEYRLTPLRIIARYPKSGQYGEMNVKILEKLAGTLELYPAKSSGAMSYVKGVGDNMYIATANSGVNGSINNDPIEISTADIPVITNVKKNAKPENTTHFLDYLSKLRSLNYKGGLKNCESNGTCPGFAGSGSYLYVDNVNPNAYALRLTNNQNGTSYLYNSAGSEMNANGCDSGYSKKYVTTISGMSIYACTPSNANSTRGNSGAIILIW